MVRYLVDGEGNVYFGGILGPSIAPRCEGLHCGYWIFTGYQWISVALLGIAIFLVGFALGKVKGRSPR